MKKTFKLMAALLALVMVLAVFASCTSGNPTESSTPKAESSTPAQTPAASTPSASTPDASSPNASTPAETPAQSTSQNLKDLLPPNINLDREMKIFVGELYDEEWMDKDDGDLVGTELYNRVLRVENSLGIELTVDKMFGDGGKRQIIIDEIKKRQQSTDPNIITDLASTYSQFAGSLTVEGVYQTINNSDNIDFDNPWWPDDLIENSTIDDKVYAVSGDISPTLIYEIYAIYYNRKLVEQYNIPDPMELVNEHKWTLDKLIEVTSDIYEDTDTTVTGPNLGDFFAFEFFDGAHYKTIPFSMGIRVIEPDADDGYVWSELYTGQKMESILEKVVNWIQGNEGVVIPTEYNTSGSRAFLREQAIFDLGNFGHAKGELAGSGIDYSVVPVPLFDEYQEKYLSYYGNPSSFWGIPSNVTNVDDSCALLEYLAADAYVYISPAVFEKALKFKYVTGDVDGISKMFDIIRDGLVFDACMLYNAEIGGYSQFSELGGTSTTWMKLFDAFKLAGMRNTIKNLVNKLRALPY